jgi:uncharacterized protein (TIGR03437 family)
MFALAHGPSFLFAAGLVLAAASTALAAPMITGGPVNAASYAVNGVPNAGIAQGSMFILFGTGMGAATFQQASTFPLPFNLGGTSVTVKDAKNATNSAIVLYNSFGGQVAAILPSSTALGNGTVTVSFNNQTSAPVPIQVVASSFGAFSVNQAGNGPAVVFNYISPTTQPVNSLLTASTPGQVETLWGTGLGAVSGNEDNGPLPGNLNIPVQVFVGGIQATVQYAGRSGCCAAIDQIQFNVPAGVTGCYVPVYAVVNGVISNFTTMAIAPQTGPCTDPIQVSSNDVNRIQARGSLNIGAVLAARYVVKVSANGVNLAGNYDNLSGQFVNVKASDTASSTGPELGGLPSLGTCQVLPFTYSSFLSTINAGANSPITEQPLTAGSKLTITGPAGAQSLTEDPQNPGVYGGQIGGFSLAGGAGLPDFLNPGSFTINNGAGEIIGAFQATLTVPQGITWTNQPSPGATISRSQNLTVTWTGADPNSEFVVIKGVSANTTTNGGELFQCAASAGLGSFTVPAALLSAIPASGNSSSGPVGFLLVGKTQLRQVTSFAAPGMDIGYLASGTIQVTNVNFQ